MDCACVLEMNQRMGLLLHGLADGCASELVAELFADHPDCRVTVPELALDVCGLDLVRTAIKRLENENKLTGMYHMLHSNAYLTDDPELAQGHWNSHSFCLGEPDGDGQCRAIRYGYLRFHGKFIKQNKGWRILTLHVRALVMFREWRCVETVRPISRSFEQLTDITCGAVHFPDPDTYIQLRNTMGRFVQEGPQQALELFSKTKFEGFSNPLLCEPRIETYDGLKAAFMEIALKEKQNRQYRIHMMSATPVFHMTQENEGAEGIFMAQLLNFIPVDGEHYKVQFCIGKVRAHFIKEDSWRFTKIEVEPVIFLAPMDFELNPERPMAMRNDKNWLCAPVRSPQTVGHASDVFEAESILPQWTERLKRGDTHVFVEQYMKNNCEDISMGLSGPRIYGYDQVHNSTGEKKDLETGSLDRRFPQFHMGVSPVAEVYENGKYVQISWLDYGWGNIGYGIYYGEEIHDRMYRPMIGQYYHCFVRDGLQWKLYSFGWKPLIQWLPKWDYCTDEVDGWAARPDTEPWPLPFEDFSGR